MKVHRYSEHQRRLWVHEMMHKTKTIKAICAEAEISRATLYNWQNELNAIDGARKEEQSGTASSLSWQPNDKYKMLLSALVKTDADKTVSRKLAREMVKRYNLTIAQACVLVNMPEEAYNHRPRKPEAADCDVYAALIAALEEKPSRSLENCIAALQGLHPDWTVKQIKRIYRQGRLYLKRTRIRRVPLLLPEENSFATAGETPLRPFREGAFWYLNLIECSVYNEEKVWLLFLLDYNDGTPLNALAGEGAVNEKNVLQLVQKAAAENGLPKKIRMPAVAPFVSRELSKWSWENKVALYNLSMAKPENILEAEYIKDDVEKQLKIKDGRSLERLNTRSENWLQTFAQQEQQAVNYFTKETMID